MKKGRHHRSPMLCFVHRPSKEQAEKTQRTRVGQEKGRATMCNCCRCKFGEEKENPARSSWRLIHLTRQKSDTATFATAV